MEASRVLAGLVVAAVMLMAPAASMIALADTYPQQVSGNVIKIGMTISLTKKFASEGQQALCGIKAAVDWYNNKGGVDIGGTKYKLQLIYYDDQSSKDQVSSLYEKLITQDKVDFLLAPYSSGLTLAALPVAEQHHKLILSHGGASDSIVTGGYHYIVQVLTHASAYMSGVAVILKEKVPDAKVALIYEDKPFAKSVINGLKQALQEKGIPIVYDHPYQAGTTDFSSLIQDAMSEGANVLLGGGHYEDGKSLVKQAHDLGWHLKFIAILVAPAQPKFYTELGKDIAEGVAYPSQWSPNAPYTPQKAQEMGLPWAGPTINEWIQLFKQECPDLQPAYQAAQAGAAIVYLVEAIKKAAEKYGPDAIKDSDKVREAFNDLHIMTFFGPLKIDPQTGMQIGHPMLIMQWQNGKQVIIYPKEYAQAEPLVAPPNWWPQAATSSPTGGAGAQQSTQSVTTSKGGLSNAAIATIIIVIIIIIIAAVYLAKK
jgi:branched-chain amino acid transport system substrate-binding protein